MRTSWLVRGLVVVVWIATQGCGSACGLALHQKATAEGAVAPGGSFFRDFPLRPQAGDMEIDLVNTDGLGLDQRGPHDAYLTDTSCAKLFDGPYPGSSPLCNVLVGPAASGKVSTRVQLDAGTYRLWVYGYTSSASDAGYVVDIDIWDHRCSPPIQ